MTFLFLPNQELSSHFVLCSMVATNSQPSSEEWLSLLQPVIPKQPSSVSGYLLLINHYHVNKTYSRRKINFSPQQLKITSSLCYPTSSTTITNVTITDNNYRLIEHLHNRIAQLEHERNVLLTSYQLLIKLLK